MNWKHGSYRVEEDGDEEKEEDDDDDDDDDDDEEDGGDRGDEHGYDRGNDNEDRRDTSLNSDASHCVVMCCHSYFIEKLISPFSKHAPISVCETQSLNNNSS
ncbi:trigger factor isoform X3 [Apis mellifera]|uniref:Trigger factor isoform X3 n=1 Tax=Apis mellifera TaxID=7460 RepID=A0A7M7GY64_APIME|nr:trigger factor isoform X3 [Apis mellifera]|eukprot:XP_006565835.2 trigger factor isoform X3 [Apis mellifera]